MSTGTEPTPAGTSGEEPSGGATSAERARPAGLTEAERAAAFRTGHSPVDRSAALRAGRVPVPRTFFLWLIVGCAVLGLGGVAAQHFIGNAGVGSVITTPLTTLAGTAPPSTQARPTGPEVGATPSALIGLKHVSARPAPALDLTDQHGRPWSLTRTRGQVTVVTFMNAGCDDICPVLAGEIDQAAHLLGPRAASVRFVVVNTDPQETSLAITPPVLTQTALGTLPSVTYLTGSLAQLNAVWKAYGVTVAVSPTVRLTTHTNLIDFIDRHGHLVDQATPIGNEDAHGVYSLDPATMHEFARGVAATASSLAGAQP